MHGLLCAGGFFFKRRHALLVVLKPCLQGRAFLVEGCLQCGRIGVPHAFALRCGIRHRVATCRDVFERGLALGRGQSRIAGNGGLLVAEHALTHRRHAGRIRLGGHAAGLRGTTDTHRGIRHGQRWNSILGGLHRAGDGLLGLAEGQFAGLLAAHLGIEGIGLGLPLVEFLLSRRHGLLHASHAVRCQVQPVLDLVLRLLDEVRPAFGLRRGLAVLEFELARAQVDRLTGIGHATLHARDLLLALFAQGFVGLVHLGGFELRGFFVLRGLPFLVGLARNDVPLGILHPRTVLLEILGAQFVVFGLLRPLLLPFLVGDLALNAAVGIDIHRALLAAILRLFGVVLCSQCGFLSGLAGFFRLACLLLSGLGSLLFSGCTRFLLLGDAFHFLGVGIGTLG